MKEMVSIPKPEYLMLITACKQALHILSDKPRFVVCDRDSYVVASELDHALSNIGEL